MCPNAQAIFYEKSSSWNCREYQLPGPASLLSLRRITRFLCVAGPRPRQQCCDMSAVLGEPEKPREGPEGQRLLSPLLHAA